MPRIHYVILRPVYRQLDLRRSEVVLERGHSVPVGPFAQIGFVDPDEPCRCVRRGGEQHELFMIAPGCNALIPRSAVSAPVDFDQAGELFVIHEMSYEQISLMGVGRSKGAIKIFSLDAFKKVSVFPADTLTGSNVTSLIFKKTALETWDVAPIAKIP